MHASCRNCNVAFANPQDEELCAECYRHIIVDWDEVQEDPAGEADYEAEAEWIAEQDGKHTLVASGALHS